ncbi:MAG TPA: hypothetical protein VNO14_18125 [Blastocatellia bacterium]|nr:hypothetical protein [Blastocatellia bacterium]
MADQLSELVKRLIEAHGDNLKSVVLYGQAAAHDGSTEEEPKKILVVLDRITPADLKAAHPVAEGWVSHGNPLPVYFTSDEIKESSDVFPIEFIDMSHIRRVLWGEDPFKSLTIPTFNLRHQLEYEMRGKLLRLRSLYIKVCNNPDRLAALMAESLDSFIVLFRHVIAMLGGEPPIEKREVVLEIARLLDLDKAVLTHIFDYAADEEVWLETETNETFARYLEQLEKVIYAINHLPTERSV